jgi:predicted DNA-binding transcriptional regulator AlpA
MPFELEAQAAERKAVKAARARELAQQRQTREDHIRAQVLAQHAAHFARGYVDLAALLHVSERLVQEIAAREDFPRPKVIGDRVKLWSVSEVVEWISRQESGNE